MKIYMDKIRSKTQDHCAEDRDTRRRIQEVVDREMLKRSFGSGGSNGNYTVEDAGYKFANLLLHLIYSNHFMPNLEAALENIEVGEPFKIGDGCHYGIYIYFGNDLTRESMSTKKTYPTVNLAWLYSEGVDHEMKPIYEWDDGRLRRSNTDIPYTGFIRQAIDDFMGNYAYDYNVIRIRLLDGITTM